MSYKILLNTLDINHDEWLKARQAGIGGSDAAAIAGLNPWKSAVGVYVDKTGPAKSIEDNERMRIGRDLEDYVARRFEEATGLKVRRRNAILQSIEYDFLLANVDRFIVGEKSGLECKTTNSYARGEWEEGIPVYYELQCHHYMAVTGFDSWWIACLIGNEKFIYKKIDRDEEIIDNLIQIEKDFWNDHVLKKEMPAPDGSEDAGDLIKMMYPESEPETVIELNNDLLESLKRREDIQVLLKKLEAEKSEIEQVIQTEMKEHETAIAGDIKITWKTVKSNRFDSKKFKEDYPDLYSQYAKQSSHRRFTVK